MKAAIYSYTSKVIIEITILSPLTRFHKYFRNDNFRSPELDTHWLLPGKSPTSSHFGFPEMHLALTHCMKFSLTDDRPASRHHHYLFSVLCDYNGKQTTPASYYVASRGDVANF